MNIDERNRKNIEKMTQKFNEMVKDETLNITNIENLLMENIENYKTNINQYMEELISNNIEEKELVSKKNENGKKKDSN